MLIAVTIALALSACACVAVPIAVVLLFRRCFADFGQQTAQGVAAALDTFGQRTRDDLHAAVVDLVTPAGEDQPSPLAVYTDQVAIVLAARIVQQLKTAAAGIASGHAKDAQAEALGSIGAQSPWMGMLAAMLPKKIRNQLMSSPQFVGQLSMLGGNHHQDPGGGGPSVRDRLSRGG